MKKASLVFVLLFGLVHFSNAAAQPAPEYKLVQEESADRNLVIEYYRKGPAVGPGEYQIWVALKDHRTSRTLLQEKSLYPNPVLVSPDESRIAVNTKYGSNSAGIELFKRTGPCAFELDKAYDAFDPWGFFQRLQGWKNAIPAHHSYSYCRAWSGDSRAMLVELDGTWDPKGDVPRGHLEKFFFALDLKTTTPTLDLGVMNRDTLSLFPRKR